MKTQENPKMTRLAILCQLHRQQGGTIHQFNHQYDTDFLALSEAMFDVMILAIKLQKEVSK